MKNAKQKLSLAVASVFPVLALGAYFFLAPVQANASSSCPAGEMSVPTCGRGAGFGTCEVGSSCINPGEIGEDPYCTSGAAICESAGCVKCEP